MTVADDGICPLAVEYLFWLIFFFFTSLPLATRLLIHSMNSGFPSLKLETNERGMNVMDKNQVRFSSTTYIHIPYHLLVVKSENGRNWHVAIQQVQGTVSDSEDGLQVMV